MILFCESFSKNKILFCCCSLFQLKTIWWTNHLHIRHFKPTTKKKMEKNVEILLLIVFKKLSFIFFYLYMWNTLCVGVGAMRFCENPLKIRKFIDCVSRKIHFFLLTKCLYIVRFRLENHQKYSNVICDWNLWAVFMCSYVTCRMFIERNVFRFELFQYIDHRVTQTPCCLLLFASNNNQQQKKPKKTQCYDLIKLRAKIKTREIAK